MSKGDADASVQKQTFFVNQGLDGAERRQFLGKGRPGPELSFSQEKA